MSARSRAATFTIGDNVYVGIGSSPKGSYTKDFWEYDAVSNSWSQKADFAGTGRELAVGFSIGNKGYIGTGLQGTGYTDPRRDFWEYNPSSNSWLAKADYPFAIFGAVGFSINGKGYIATGYDWTQLHGDCFEYDVLNNKWTPNSATTGRYAATCFTIGNKAYIGNGDKSFFKQDQMQTRDFYEFDPAIKTWTQLTPFGGKGRHLHWLAKDM